jgi:hypothetical protein
VSGRQGMASSGREHTLGKYLSSSYFLSLVDRFCTVSKIRFCQISAEPPLKSQSEQQVYSNVIMREPTASLRSADRASLKAEILANCHSFRNGEETTRLNVNVIRNSNKTTPLFTPKAKRNFKRKTRVRNVCSCSSLNSVQMHWLPKVADFCDPMALVQSSRIIT